MPSLASASSRAPTHIRRAVLAAVTALLVSLVGAPLPAGAGSKLPPTVGWHTPWALGGPRVENGVLVNEPPTWPGFPVTAVRLWDTHTTWADLEPARGVYDWGALDAHVAKAHAEGVNDITLVLWGTPSWSTDLADTRAAPWLGPYSASPPRVLNDWLDFVRQVAHRYAGQITAYEIGNEPDLPWFWNGTSTQLVDMVDAAAREIRAEDPSAMILPPAMVFRDEKVPPLATTVWQGLAARRTPLDAVTFHAYPDAGPGGVARPELVADAAYAAACGASAAGLWGLPVWLTELNYVDVTEPITPWKLRARTQRALASTPVARYFWYAFGQDVDTRLFNIAPVTDTPGPPAPASASGVRRDATAAPHAPAR